MVWCSHCGKDQRTEHDDINGFLCCTGCGRVVDDNIFSSDPTFIKSGAESQLSGNLVRYNQYSANRSFGVSSGGYEYKTDSHERTLDRGKEEIELIAGNLSLSQRDNIVESSHRLYIIAVERGFTKGRRVKQVAGATLYIICRQEQKPILLIDISDILQINIYVLGAVFLQLCGVLRLLQHPIIQKPVDPCLFIHRFADRLLGRSATRKQYHSICNTALRILTSMKRDWLQTGRKPSGLCGAALYISALSHGISCTKSEVISVVHICEATLTKRLIEFEETESGSLTIEEFESKAKELETEMQSFCSPANNQKMIESVPELVCEHKDLNGTSHFAHGLCHSCYEEIMKISGGLQGGSNPPAFQRAEKKRQEEALSKKQAELFEDEEDEENENQSISQESLKQSVSAQETSDLDRKLGGVKSMPEKSALACDIAELQDECATASKGILSSDVGNGSSDKEDIDEMNMKGDGENEEHDETLSDIDDNEVDGYLHNEEEIKLKTIIWTEMNKDYLEELAEKEAANAAAHKAEKEAEEAEANGANNAVELRAKANALKKFKKKERTYKRAEETAKKVPAESAAEATRQILIKKKLSSKVNYDVLQKLFDEKKEDVTEFLDNEVVEAEGGSRKRTVTWEDDHSEPHKKKADTGLIEKESEPKDEEADSMIDDEINYEDNDEQCQSFSLQYGAADYEDDYEEY